MVERSRGHGEGTAFGLARDSRRERKWKGRRGSGNKSLPPVWGREREEWSGMDRSGEGRIHVNWDLAGKLHPKSAEKRRFKRETKDTNRLLGWKKPARTPVRMSWSPWGDS